MVFSSLSFLFYFLPTILFLYYILPKKFRYGRNFVLLIGSLFFYFVGEPKAIVVMLLSIFINYIGGIAVNSGGEKQRKISLTIVVILNLTILFYYKYLMFIVGNLSKIFDFSVETKSIYMPIGISFFTFQGMSYVFDVYMKNAEVKKNPLDIALYISLFPQLIAGPIVRYKTVADEIDGRVETLDLFSTGVIRFIVGLSKKVLLANKFGIIADEIFKLNGNYNLSVPLSWFGVLMFALQIYYDFSGYSDMAIGLGKMFGFNFLENFDYPYISKSITEFWRRWHMSLGTWFRDYIYIPLGGNRVSVPRHILNMFIVWFLTGFWHGASWNYIIWGLYFFVFLVIEKYVFGNKFEKVPEIFRHLYALIVILVGWVIFKEENSFLLLKYLKAMFSVGLKPTIGGVTYYLKEYYIEIFLGIIFSANILKAFEKGKKTIPAISIYFILLILSIVSLFSSSYNPFIYFRF
ncbi:alginate O-acetyltransferase complex protein AlgI [Ezakiella coagulans]|uniref:Alginate O-acetyltransferase complex protein AlgI n=1 Tax=Ezakiella coagulans TaxID=46507 RepID=A0A2U1E712_9FIRM|nr:MBOAT family O-acyltransferase [Ezakiella coagulans]PVY95721.1 alginate O-acetyltransferase complex protein AlgI [Ezakiella coagulans]